MEGRKLRLSDLPESILLHILSMLRDGKEVVRSSVLSTQWRYLWKSVPLSLDFYHWGSSRKANADFVTSTTRELYYWRPCCQNIRTIKFRLPPRYEQHFAKDVDLWVHFATQVANVEALTLEVPGSIDTEYEFPQFAFKNASLKNLILCYSILNPSGIISWTSLVSLSISSLSLTDGVMENVLSGCPNLESLNIDGCRYLSRLHISSVKLRELIITSHENGNNALCLEIFAPYLQKLQLLRYSDAIRLTNVASLVTAVLSLDIHFNDGDSLKKELVCLKELLISLACVENLELGGWFIKCLSVLELEGGQFTLPSLKFVKLNRALEQWEFPGICSLLQSSSDLETLVIDWDKHYSLPRDLWPWYMNKDELSKRFKTHNYNCALLHLKTIKFINLSGSVSSQKFVLSFAKYLLKNAIMLEKFIIGAKFKGRHDVLEEYVKMEKKFLSLRKSSSHVSIIFPYC